MKNRRQKSRAANFDIRRVGGREYMSTAKLALAFGKVEFWQPIPPIRRSLLLIPTRVGIFFWKKW